MPHWYLWLRMYILVLLDRSNHSYLKKWHHYLPGISSPKPMNCSSVFLFPLIPRPIHSQSCSFFLYLLLTWSLLQPLIISGRLCFHSMLLNIHYSKDWSLQRYIRLYHFPEYTSLSKRRGLQYKVSLSRHSQS